MRQLAGDSLEYEIDLSDRAKFDLDQFIRNQRLETGTLLTRAAASGTRCRFENTAVPKRGGRVEVISQFHPLVRFVTRRVQETDERPHPAVAIQLAPDEAPDGVAPGAYVFSVQLWSFQALQDIEQVHYAAVSYDDPESALGDELAEQLVVACSSRGRNWIGVGGEVDFPQAARIADECCLARSEDRFGEFEQNLRCQNEDRADLQLSTLEKHLARQRTKLEEVRDRHREKDRASLVKATEGRIRALDSRAEMKRIEIERRRQTASRRRDISVGVVRVGEVPTGSLVTAFSTCRRAVPTLTTCSPTAFCSTTSWDVRRRS